MLLYPLLLWCLNLINSAALDYDYAGAGCLGAAMLYAYAMVTAVAGLSLAGQPHRYSWCRTLAYIQLAAGTLLCLPLGPYALLTLPPLFLLTGLYLCGMGWRGKTL